jgi:hypothetical protein
VISALSSVHPVSLSVPETQRVCPDVLRSIVVLLFVEVEPNDIPSRKNSYSLAPSAIAVI